MKEDSSSAGAVVVPRKNIFREYGEAILIAVVLAFFIRTFVVQAFKIPSASMEPTLLVGDHILVNKFIYGIKIPFMDKTLVSVKEPRRGDIVVFKFPENPDKDFIKRVIAVPGDTVRIMDKKVYINDELADEPYGVFTDLIPGGIRPRDNLGPVTVPEDSFFVMGDNRDHSYDSRFWGFVKRSAVKGKAFLIYWSWDGANSGVRWGRLGAPVQ